MRASCACKLTCSVIFCVQYDGVTNYYNTPYLVDLINQGSLIVPDFDIIVPEQFIYPEQREHSYVPGSPKAVLSIIGMYMLH